MHGIGRKTFLVLFGLTCLCTTVWSRYQKCDGRNPPSLRVVTADKMSRRWFTQRAFKEFPNNGVPDGQFMSEFTMDVKPHGKIVVNGRTPYKPGGCLYEVVDSKRIGKAAFKFFANYLNKDVEIRILDTDFRNFIILWMCFRYKPYNPKICTDWAVDTCTSTIEGNLSKSQWKRVDRSLEQTICFSDVPFFRPDPKKICKRLRKSYGKGYGRKNTYW